ncbi:HK97 family phage prohead protease [Alkalicaulis satelles]|nr:HK97 family phage prohead protease [Alkalicaulis satelles]
MPAQDGSGVMLEMAGYASLFDEADHGGDIVRRGAFAASLARRGAAGVRMLFQHDAGEPVGVWDAITEDGRGLYVRGRLMGDAPRGRAALSLVRNGAVDGLSIGFRTRHSRPRPGGGRELLEIDLWEVSIVTFPMLAGARLSVLAGPGAVRARAAA